MTQNAERLRFQGEDEVPDPQHEQKILALDKIRLRLDRARYDFRIAQTKEKEIALQKLVREEAELSAEVGFGVSPAPRRIGLERS
jgi:hypothetical protein